MIGNPPLQALLADLAAEREARRVLGRLVSALEAAYRIPPGDHLVCVLGEGTDRTNREALFTWIRRELRRLEVTAAAQHLPHLADRLNDVLTAWESERRLM